MGRCSSSNSRRSDSSSSRKRALQRSSSKGARGIGEHGHTLRVAHPDPKGREHGGRPRDDHVTAAEPRISPCVHSGRATVGEDREACGVEATLDGDAPIRSAI